MSSAQLLMVLSGLAALLVGCTQTRDDAATTLGSATMERSPITVACNWHGQPLTDVLTELRHEWGVPVFLGEALRDAPPPVFLSGSMDASTVLDWLCEIYGTMLVRHEETWVLVADPDAEEPIIIHAEPPEPVRHYLPNWYPIRPIDHRGAFVEQRGSPPGYLHRSVGSLNNAEYLIHQSEAY